MADNRSLGDVRCPRCEGCGDAIPQLPHALGCPQEPWENDGPVLGYCPHGVDLDRDFCPEGCRV